MIFRASLGRSCQLREIGAPIEKTKAREPSLVALPVDARHREALGQG